MSNFFQSSKIISSPPSPLVLYESADHRGVASKGVTGPSVSNFMIPYVISQARLWHVNIAELMATSWDHIHLSLPLQLLSKT